MYVTGRVAIESPRRVVTQAEFPARQGRLAFAYLVQRHGPVPHEELADLLWAEGPPSSWRTALSAIVSKLRRLLRDVDLSEALVSALGCYELRLPSGTWIDIDAAASAAHDAEAALSSGDDRTLATAASVAYHITRRTFLAGDEGPWVDEQRAQLLALHNRAAECLATASLRQGQPALAVALAEELVGNEPFREPAYQLLMRAHVAAGSRAEALHAYERCRRVLADELGTDPSPETQALHLQILVAGQ